MSIETISRLAAQRIRPLRSEEETVQAFVSRLVAAAERISGLPAVVCGSIGKHTWLKGDHDIDLFILFPAAASREELETQGIAVGRRIVAEMKGKLVIKYAEHPYVHSFMQSYRVDIVPCYALSKGEHIKSAVDRSPLHLEYVLAHLDASLRDDARLLKQFCKAAGVYGSDAKTQGFSGYLCELLVIHYKGFANATRAAADWKPPVLIDIEKFGTRGQRDQPLVIIDPTDRQRNAAANLSSENFVRFVRAAQQFVKKPRAAFFVVKEPQPLSAAEIKKLGNRGTHFVAVMFAKPDVIDDILYPQLRRSLKRLENVLHHEDFSVVRNCAHAEARAMLCFELDVWRLPKIKKMTGPPIFSSQHSKEFLVKYKNAFVEGTMWVAEKKRVHTTAHALLKAFIRNSVTALKESGIPENVAAPLRKATVVEGSAFWAMVRKDKDVSAQLRRCYFSWPV